LTWLAVRIGLPRFSPIRVESGPDLLTDFDGTPRPLDADLDGEPLPDAGAYELDPDVDGDGYPSDALGGSDCDDDDPATYPGATEVCGDGVDQDCADGDLPCDSGEDTDTDAMDDTGESTPTDDSGATSPREDSGDTDGKDDDVCGCAAIGHPGTVPTWLGLLLASLRRRSSYRPTGSSGSMRIGVVPGPSAISHQRGGPTPT